MNLKTSFTQTNDHKLEELINFEVNFVTQVIKDILGEKLVSIWLIGGYGRGEGGVDSVSGKKVPKNNYDFLVVLDKRLITQKMRGELIKKVVEMTQSHISIPLEISLRSFKQAKKTENIMIYRDILNSSYTAYGLKPEEVMPLQKGEQLPKVEALKIIRNRGMLLMASEENLGHYGYDSNPKQKKIWRAKAVIGYVDALLIIKNKYVTSYKEKNDTFQSLDVSDILNPFEENLLKKSMSLATQYRFFGDTDTEVLFGEDIMEILQKVHSHVKSLLNIELPRRLGELKLYFQSEGFLRVFRNVVYNIVSFRFIKLPLLFVHPRDQLNFIVPYLFYKKEVPATVRREFRHLSCREKALETYVRYLV